MKKLHFKFIIPGFAFTTAKEPNTLIIITEISKENKMNVIGYNTNTQTFKKYSRLGIIEGIVKNTITPSVEYRIR